MPEPLQLGAIGLQDNVAALSALFTPTRVEESIRAGNRARNKFKVSGVKWLDDQSAWSYTMMPCMQGKFLQILRILRERSCVNVLEIGGGLHPMDHFAEFRGGYVNVDPMATLQVRQTRNGNSSAT